MAIHDERCQPVLIKKKKKTVAGPLFNFHGTELEPYIPVFCLLIISISSPRFPALLFPTAKAKKGQ